MDDLEEQQREMRERNLAAAKKEHTVHWMEIYTPREVAQMLRVTESTIYRQFAKYPGVIDLGTPSTVRPRKLRRRLLRIPRPVLEKFIAERVRFR